MKSILTFIFFIPFYTSIGQAQGNSNKPKIDKVLADKITISGFCLCQTSLSDLQKLSNDFKKVEVEEMDLPKKCFGEDARFENGKGYYSEKYTGIIFQKDHGTDLISKIRLTKDFKGNLPYGQPIDLNNLTLKDVFKMYPDLKDKWGSRGCSNYWSFSNDTLLFYVKIDTSKKPQFPIDEAYYFDKPIEAIDLRISCYGIIKKTNKRFEQLFNDPVYFIDSVNVTRIELQKYEPTEIAFVSVYKDANAIKLIGEQGKYGAIYIETKKFAKSKYWNYFKAKSSDYLRAVPNPQSDSLVAYILNDKVLTTNYESDLSRISDKPFIDLKIIDKNKLAKDYGITDKICGI